MLKNGCIYEFTCAENCRTTYIGESKRLLKVRISEHFQNKKKVEEQSAIYKHTSNCEHFKNSLTQELAKKPNARPSEKLKLRQAHIQSHFRAIDYCSNTSKRKTIEALMISLYEPELNRQVARKKTFLI